MCEPKYRPFKVWDKERIVTKGFTVSSFQELKNKGCEKLQIDPPVTVVLAEDGTEIDEEYFSFLPDNTVFMLLPGRSEWMPPHYSITSYDHPDGAVLECGRKDCDLSSVIEKIKVDLACVVLLNEDEMHDRHAGGNYQPGVDSSQDWHLVNAAEVEEFTTLTFIRKLDTCDPEDLPITLDTVKVIFSYNPEDPVDADILHYHGESRRGAKSVLLLSPPSNVRSAAPLPDDVITFEFLNGNYSVPSRDTTYFCKVFKLPDLEQKHHVIRLEPVIQPGHEQLVHHNNLYYCPGSISERLVGESYLCYYETPIELKNCRNIFVGWAVGAQAFNAPEMVGIPLGTPADPKYFILETHFNNPTSRMGYVDNSGLRMFLTKQLRQYDAGYLNIGSMVNTNQIIPPNDANFLTSGHCHADCLNRALGDQEIIILADFLHSHLLGRKMRTRHFRDGIELEPIMADNHYDFNYQENRILRQERVVKKGDSLLQECFYDSTGKNVPTFGGLSTNHEMCMAFLLYYPRISLTHCKSSVQYTVPEEFAGQDMPSLVMKLDWSDPSVRQKFSYSVDNSDILNECWFDDNVQSTYKVTPVPKYVRTYKEPENCVH